MEDGAKTFVESKAWIIAQSSASFTWNLETPLSQPGTRKPILQRGWKTTLAILIIESVSPSGPSGQGLGNSLHWLWSERTVWPNNGNIDFNAQRILVELSKLSRTEGEYRSLSFPWGAKRVISVLAASTHPISIHPAMISCWKQFSQTNICRCPENSATSFFCPLPSCYTAIRPDIICTIAPCWQCIESEMGVFWELMLHWCPVAMGPQLWHEVMTFLFGHIVTYWVDTNYPDSLSTNLAAGSGQGSHSPIHGMAFEVTTTTVRL